LEEIVSMAMKARHVRATKSNKESHRGHLIVNVTFDHDSRHGKLVMVDLAGPSKIREREDWSAEESEDTKCINESLLALGKVFRGLQEKAAYRDDPLTILLRPIYCNNENPTKTLIITCLSPLSKDIEDSLNDLRRFAKSRI
jgi:hypothetical protein